MKKIILIAAVFCTTISCGSKKGAWSEEDKTKARNYIKQSEGSLDFLGNKKEQFVQCYLEKVENTYENFDDANADTKGCDNLTANCLGEILMSK
jgi:hypothetical protein